MSGFGKGVGKYADRTAKNLERIKKGVGIKLFGAVIYSTPVLTGRLRANWLCEINAYASGTTKQTSPDGSVAIAAMTSKVMGSKGDDTLVLRNNLPYAYRVEFEGWSHTKAPNGMMRHNVARFRELLQKQLGDLGISVG